MILHAEIILEDDQTGYVTGEYIEPSRGRRDEYGAPLEPDTPSCMAVHSVFDEEGEEVELTDDLREKAEEALWCEVGSVPDTVKAYD